MTYLKEGALLKGNVRKMFPYGAQIRITGTNRRYELNGCKADTYFGTCTVTFENLNIIVFFILFLLIFVTLKFNKFSTYAKKY